jgi:hypothetical protein
MYTYIINTVIIGTPPTIQRSDGAIIPSDPDNIDYVEYLAWVADGNTADPAD